MHKLLFALLILAATNANAEAWMAKNNAGGEIVITDSVCSLNGKTYNSLLQGYTRTSGGASLDGCWYYDNMTVHMVYEDGSKYAYPVNGFSKMDYM